jgi:uncharacterized RDD family membrane protein YckC
MTAPQVLAAPVLAARRHRFAAALIDSLILLVATFLIELPFAAGPESTGQSALVRIVNPYAGGSGLAIQVAASVVSAAYFWVQHALWGQTPGKRLCHLKVVSGSTGQTPGMRQAGRRRLPFSACSSASSTCCGYSATAGGGACMTSSPAPL